MKKIILLLVVSVVFLAGCGKSTADDYKKMENKMTEYAKNIYENYVKDSAPSIYNEQRAGTYVHVSDISQMEAVGLDVSVFTDPKDNVPCNKYDSKTEITIPFNDQGQISGDPTYKTTLVCGSYKTGE